jgi:shikimate dehydrogenase
MNVKGTTLVYGIMGNPVSHSMSPAMHNQAFQECNIDSVYVPFPVEDVAGAMAGFRALHVRGVSVTIPHKKAVMAFVDELDPVAEKIGAVNTLVCDKGHIKGYNTDWVGANRALETRLDLVGKDVIVLGGGGSARAIGFGLVEAGAKPVIVCRNDEQGMDLGCTLDCPWYPLTDLNDLEADCLINATSVGMGKDADVSLVDSAKVGDFAVVMDIVYAPLQTRLLREAEEAGCAVIDGLQMLLLQGVAQFELWTGQKAPVESMRKVLYAHFGVR